MPLIIDPNDFDRWLTAATPAGGPAAALPRGGDVGLPSEQGGQQATRAPRWSSHSYLRPEARSVATAALARYSERLRLVTGTLTRLLEHATVCGRSLDTGGEPMAANDQRRIVVRMLDSLQRDILTAVERMPAE